MSVQLPRLLRLQSPAFRLIHARQYAKKVADTAPTDAKSSCAADTVLVGVNYLKGQAPVVALPDDEYPDWLWTLLQKKVVPEDGAGGLAEKARMKAERRRSIKDRNFMSTQ